MPQMRAADDKSMGTASCPEAVPKFNGVRDPQSVFRRRFSLLLNHFSARIIPQIACGHDRFVPVCGHEKKTSLQACLFCTITLRSDGALNLVGAEASRTDVNMAGSAVNDSLDALHVRLPRTRPKRRALQKAPIWAGPASLGRAQRCATVHSYAVRRW